MNINPIPTSGNSRQKWLWIGSSVILLVALCGVALFGIKLLSSQGNQRATVRPVVLSPSQTPTMLDTQNDSQMKATATEHAQYVATVRALARNIGKLWIPKTTGPFETSGVWSTIALDNDLVSVINRMDDGRYHLETTAKKGCVIPNLYGNENYWDFYLSIRGKITSGTGYFGILFRDSPQGYYIFIINQEGKYDLSFFDKVNKKWAASLIAQAPLSSKRPYKEFTLSVLTQDDHISYFIDNQWYGTINDQRSDYGKLGLVLDISQGGKSVFDLDDFSLYTPGAP